MKRCSGCGETKDLDQFGKRSQRRDGTDTQCRVCRRAEQKRKTDKWSPERRLEQSRKINARRAVRERERYEVQLKAQGGVCAICRRRPVKGQKRFARDHCHRTGRKRDLLCGDCNYGLGCFKDDPQRLREAIRYLKRHA